MSSIIRCLAYPVLVAFVLGLSLSALGSGQDPRLVAGVANFLAMLLVAMLERIFPYEPDWNRPRGDVRADILHSLLSSTIPLALCRGLLFGWLTHAALWLRHAAGQALWPSSLPLALQLGLGLVVAEALHYWYHRWAHVSTMGWRLHSVHHSAERLYWLNGLRGHPLDVLLGYLAENVPLVLLGAPDEVLVMVTSFIGINGLLKHSNLDHRVGFLNWIVSSAELHRWHHSADLRVAQCNYGNNLILWDWLFGTRHLPQQRPPTELGIPEFRDFPRSYWAQLLIPFRWPNA